MGRGQELDSVAIWQAAPIRIGATSSMTQSKLTNVPAPIEM